MVDDVLSESQTVAEDTNNLLERIDSSAHTVQARCACDFSIHTQSHDAPRKLAPQGCIARGVRGRR